MAKGSSKKQALKEIDEFFKNIRWKSPEEIKKIKKLAMSFNLKLGERKRLFCKKCLVPYSGNEKVRIKKGIKTIVCENCSYVARFRLKIKTS